jgi:hypothetical protein
MNIGIRPAAAGLRPWADGRYCGTLEAWWTTMSQRPSCRS